MEAVRHWALTLCIGCVLCGALQMMLPDKGAGKVIKAVLALYILLSAVRPGPETDWPAVWQQIQRMPQPEARVPFDPARLTQSGFYTALCPRLEALLRQNGISAQVQAGPAGEGTNPDSLTVWVWEKDQCAAARELIRQEVGPELTLHCQVKDEAE